MAKKLVNGVWVDEPDVQQTGQQQTQGTDWLGQMNEYMNKIQNREPFQFDLDKNALYQQYKNQYTLAGQKAMRDTMGQAAALTGGYGNSYAQNVGQQAYDTYLEKLNAVVPELYAQARSEYDQAGNDLYNQFNLARQMYGDQYDRDRDALSDQRYQDELAYSRERDYLSDQRYQNELDWSRQQSQQSDARSYATYLLQMGIMPSEEQLAAAGITGSEASQILAYYKSQMAGSGSGSGSTGGGTKYIYQTEPEKEEEDKKGNPMLDAFGTVADSIGAAWDSLGLGRGNGSGGNGGNGGVPTVGDGLDDWRSTYNPSRSQNQVMNYQGLSNMVQDRDTRNAGQTIKMRNEILDALYYGVITQKQSDQLLAAIGLKK